MNGHSLASYVSVKSQVNTSDGAFQVKKQKQSRRLQSNKRDCNGEKIYRRNIFGHLTTIKEAQIKH